MGTDPGVGSQSQGLAQDGHNEPARLRRVWRLPNSLAKGLSLPSGVALSMTWKLGQLVAIYHHSGEPTLWTTGRAIKEEGGAGRKGGLSLGTLT